MPNVFFRVIEKYHDYHANRRFFLNENKSQIDHDILFLSKNDILKKFLNRIIGLII